MSSNKCSSSLDTDFIAFLHISVQLFGLWNVLIKKCRSIRAIGLSKPRNHGFHGKT